MWNVTDLGSGVPLLWLHGFPLDSSIFEKQTSIAGVRHLLPDLPGFGRSPAAPRELSMDDYARVAFEVLDQRRIEKAIFAGFSMGGYVCFAAARMAPQRISGLILIDTRETADTDDARNGRFQTIEKVKQHGIQPVVDSMLPKMLTPAAPKEMKDRVREIMNACSPEGVIAALRAMASRGDSSSLLPKISVPTLIVVGEEDSITPPADAERMAKAIPDARLVKIAGAAHLSIYEKADEVNDAIQKYLK